MLGKILVFVASIAVTMGLVQGVMSIYPTGESEIRAILVCLLVTAYPFQTYWALKKFCGGL